jgi:hypothetical protein
VERDRGLEVLPVAIAARETRIAWMRELRPSAPALLTRWAKYDISPASWRFKVRAASITGWRREWVAEKYQRFQCFSPQPRRL